MLPAPKRCHMTPLGEELVLANTPFEESTSTSTSSPFAKKSRRGGSILDSLLRIPYEIIGWCVIKPFIFTVMLWRWLFAPTFSFEMDRILGCPSLWRTDVRHGPSRTSLLVAKARYECEMLGLSGDYLARRFTPFELRLRTLWKLFGRSLVREMDPHDLTVLAVMQCRTVAFDRFVVNAKKRQVVMLGAGMDTRAYRLIPERVPRDDGKDASSATGVEKFFEVDIASTQKFKKSVVESHPEEFPTSRVTYVSVDFSRESFLDRLVANGFNPREESAFLLEGVSYYLTWEALKDTLTKVASLPAGTLLAMDYFVAIPNDATLRNTKRWVALLGEPMDFMADPARTPQSIFEPLGFEVIAHLGAEAIQRNFLPSGTLVPPEAVASYVNFVVLRVKG